MYFFMLRLFASKHNMVYYIALCMYFITKLTKLMSFFINQSLINSFYRLVKSCQDICSFFISWQITFFWTILLTKILFNKNNITSFTTHFYFIKNKSTLNPMSFSFLANLKLIFHVLLNLWKFASDSQIFVQISWIVKSSFFINLNNSSLNIGISTPKHNTVSFFNPFNPIILRC